MVNVEKSAIIMKWGSQDREGDVCNLIFKDDSESDGFFNDWEHVGACINECMSLCY